MKIIIDGHEVWNKTMDVEELTQNLAKLYNYEKYSYNYDRINCSYEINLTDRPLSKKAQDKTETEKTQKSNRKQKNIIENIKTIVMQKKNI